MSEVDILKYAVGILSALGTVIGSALIGVVVWNAKAIINSIGELRKDVSAFDRRITRLEAKAHWRLHERRAAGDK